MKKAMTLAVAITNVNLLRGMYDKKSKSSQDTKKIL